MSNMKHWGRVLAMTDTTRFTRVFVQNGTAQVTNGHVLLRRGVSLPDGTYFVDSAGNLELAPPSGFTWPDFESIRPSFELAQPFQLDPTTMNTIIDTSALAQQEGCLLGLGYDHVALVKDTPDGKKSIAYPLSRPTGLSCQFTYTPTYIQLALLEALIYDSVYVIKEPQSEQKKHTPIVFGKNWGSCTLVMNRI